MYEASGETKYPPLKSRRFHKNTNPSDVISTAVGAATHIRNEHSVSKRFASRNLQFPANPTPNL